MRAWSRIAAVEYRALDLRAHELLAAVAPSPGGHHLFWAIHVAPVGALTRPYMALIDPLRRFLVYPSLLARFHKAWIQAEGTVD
ncbi:MAG: DUF2867 domain-containing protein [Gemmatimonadales bacterium]|nr:DUF2867 domain-containing protein [Gemmatimonadales bacterium]